MALNVVADPITRIIRIIKPVVDGQTNLSVEAEIYSELKSDWKDDTTLNRLFFPFRVVGGDDLGEGRKSGAYYFLRNDLGWRIQSSENDHELIINGNLFANDTSQPIFIPTDNDYTVAIRLNTSQLTQQIDNDSDGSGTVIDINAIAVATAQAVWDHSLNNINTTDSTGDLLKNKLLRFREWFTLKEK